MSTQSAGEAKESTDGGNDTETTSGSLASAVLVLETLKKIVQRQVLGRDEVIELAIIALIADGHILLEDFPGSGKTTLAKALGEAIKNHSNTDDTITAFRRIQFTPDLLPSDVTGSSIFDSNSSGFHFRHGPIFAHVVLADEINRTSPKVQSAMLEAMGEKQVTVDNITYPLNDLFFVIATQNPLDLVGTYPLPTPQLDRFLFKVTMNHIDRDAELEVLDSYRQRKELTNKQDTVSQNEILKARAIIEKEVHISSEIKIALIDISRNLRKDDRILQGNSTRSMVLLLPALQVSAALKGRNYVSTEDVELLIPHVLNHRIEFAPGITDFTRVFQENMAAPIETLAKSTLG